MVLEEAQTYGRAKLSALSTSCLLDQSSAHKASGWRSWSMLFNPCYGEETFTFRLQGNRNDRRVESLFSLRIGRSAA